MSAREVSAEDLQVAIYLGRINRRYIRERRLHNMKLETFTCGVCGDSYLAASFGSDEIPICGQCEIELAEWRDADRAADLIAGAAAILPEPF